MKGIKDPKPSLSEILETIQELSDYKERLTKEVLLVSKKLRMPEQKIDSVLKENIELKKIDAILLKLMEEKQAFEKGSKVR